MFANQSWRKIPVRMLWLGLIFMAVGGLLLLLAVGFLAAGVAVHYILPALMVGVGLAMVSKVWRSRVAQNKDAGAGPTDRGDGTQFPVAGILALAGTVLGAGISAGLFKAGPSPTASILPPGEKSLTGAQLVDYGFTVAGQVSHIPNGKDVWLADKFVGDDSYFLSAPTLHST